MYTIMYWTSKDELRAVYIDETGPACNHEFHFLPEHLIEPPLFETSAEAFAYIAEFHPEMQP